MGHVRCVPCRPRVFSTPRTPQALLLLHRRAATPEERPLVEAAKLLVLLNLCFTYLKLERPAPALCYGKQALVIDQRNPKALFRCGQVSQRRAPEVASPGSASIPELFWVLGTPQDQGKV